VQILDPESAVRKLPARGRALIAPGCGFPTALGDALGDARDAFEDLELCTALVMQPVRFLDAVPAPFRLLTTHVTAATEPLVQDGRADYLPLRYSQMPIAFAPDGMLPVDAVLIQVSPPDARGYCTLGASVSACLDLVPRVPLVVAEINARAPRTHGNVIHVSQIDVACEVDRPLIPYKPVELGEVERSIARYVAQLVQDGACFQIGIGAIPQAILEALAGHRDLGLHSGLICDGMIPLIEQGAITGARKNVDRWRMVGGEAMGTDALYRYVDGNPAFDFVSAIHSHGLAFVAQIENFVAINSAVEVDLSGQVNAEWVAGRQMSGIGGQFDYVEAAMYSRGGRSIVALPSTAARGSASRIVRTLAAGAPVTTPRYCVDFVVTEYGTADLRGKGIHARARALAAIAHPQFRDALLAEARIAGAE
jgi:4-hydroxybutyrate CoA-transferase